MNDHLTEKQKENISAKLVEAEYDFFMRVAEICDTNEIEFMPVLNGVIESVGTVLQNAVLASIMGASAKSVIRASFDL